MLASRILEISEINNILESIENIFKEKTEE